MRMLIAIGATDGKNELEREIVCAKTFPVGKFISDSLASPRILVSTS
jgi:hypothetical protein